MSPGALSSPRDTAPGLREIDAGAAGRLLDAAGDILLWLDAEGRITDVRAHDGELFKTARRDWIDKRWQDVVTIESREKVQALMAAALSTEDAAPNWRQVNHPLGRGPDLPVLYAALRLSGGAGPRTGSVVLAVGRDLRPTETLQRRLVDAQQAMERDYWRFREAEARYRSLFQASSEAVLVVDAASLRVVEINPAAQTLLEAGTRGGKAGRTVGSGWTGLFAAEASEPLAAALAAARSVGRHVPVVAPLAGQKLSVAVSISIFHQNEAAFLLVRLAPQAAGGRRRGAAVRSEAVRAPDADAAMSVAFARGAADALAFTDASGRLVSVNRSFVRLAQLSSEDQARGQMLDRWLGRTGVEISVLLANLRKDGSTGLFETELRGEQGIRTEVEVAASPLEPAGDASFAFSIRDVSRRLAPVGRAATEVPTSVGQLAELVGRVPLKQIVAETSDLIERLSIESALVITRDNRALAAQLLGLSRQSLYVKLRRFGLGGLGPEDPLRTPDEV
jgi:transcriptional regulator PpsR